MSQRDERAEPTPEPAGGGPARRGRGGGSTSTPAPTSIAHNLWVFVREVVIVVVLAVVLSLIAKTWLVQSFWIPSASMNNTLVEDDRVMVSLLTPGPFDLGRGDIVVFKDPGGWIKSGEQVPRQQQGKAASALNDALSWVGLLPNDEGNHLIKRVIGLPGDHVQCCTADKRLIVNGTPITEPYVKPGPDQTTGQIGNFDIRVPAGRVWVMGDNRNNSSDSRFNDGPANDGSAGSVPIDDIVGRAFAIVWPLNHLTWLGEPSDTFANVPAPAAASPARTPATTGQP